MYRLLNVRLETGLHVNLRSNIRAMSIGNNKILILNGKHKGLQAEVLCVFDN